MDDIADALDEMVSVFLRTFADRQGLSVTAMTCLARIRDEGPLRLTALAAVEGVSQPSMSQLVKRLGRLGLVTRVGDPGDGRASLVALTDQGRSLLADRRRTRHDRIADLVTALPADDAAALRLAMHVALPLVRRLADAGREARTGAEPQGARP